MSLEKINFLAGKKRNGETILSAGDLKNYFSRIERLH